MFVPWEHQNDAVPTLLKQNYMLIWDPGTGKTYPMLRAAKERGGRALFLGPPAIRTQVAREAVEYELYDRKDIFVVQSGKDKIPPQAKLVICSYDHLIDQKLWKQMFKLDWRTLCLDEAHALKNTAAKRTRATYGARLNSPGALYKRADRVILSTGTPLLNNPSDFWTHVSRVFPQVLVDLNINRKDEWIDRFCHTKDTPYGVQILGGKNLPELKRALSPYVSRIKKESVIDIPPLNVTKIWVPATEIDMTDLPQEAVDELMRLLADKNKDNFEQLATPLSSLRRRIGLAKAGHVSEIVATELDGGIEKAIVFYHHKDVGAEIVSNFSARKSLKDQVVQYSGGLTQSKRDEIVARFTKDKSCRVMVAQIQAAGTGLNLQAAERVIIAEPAWTPALNEQAIARAYRAGQKKRVWASYVCLADSIDESITTVLMRKQRIIEGAIG